MSTRSYILFVVAVLVSFPIGSIASATEVVAPPAQSVTPQTSQSATPQSSAADDGDALAQIKLSARMLDQFIGCQTTIKPLMDQVPEDQEEPDAKTLADLDKTAKACGFKDFAGYQSVGNSIIVVLDGFDPDTKNYVGKELLIKSAIDEVKKDTTMKASERKAALRELNAELAEVQPVEFTENIALIAKYYDRLIPLFPSNS